MDRRTAVEALPLLHAHALRLLDRGVAPATVAAQLGLTTDELATLVQIAEAKVARLLDDPGAGTQTNAEPMEDSDD